LVKYVKNKRPKNVRSFIRERGGPNFNGVREQSSLIKEYEKEIDTLISHLFKRIKWQLKKMSTLGDDLSTHNKSSVSVSQLVGSLDRLFALKGIKFPEPEDAEDVLLLMNRLKELKEADESKSNEASKDLNKQVEEVIKDFARRKR
jgi:hypothetical protein